MLRFVLIISCSVVISAWALPEPQKPAAGTAQGDTRFLGSLLHGVSHLIGGGGGHRPHGSHNFNQPHGSHNFNRPHGSHNFNRPHGGHHHNRPHGGHHHNRPNVGYQHRPIGNYNRPPYSSIFGNQYGTSGYHNPYAYPYYRQTG